MGTSREAHITNVFGPQSQVKKVEFHAQLSRLSNLFKNQPWVINGDFNMILNKDKKIGGVRHLEEDNRLFEEFIHEKNLVDLEPSNGITT